MYSKSFNSESFDGGATHPNIYSAVEIEKIIDSHLPQFCSRPIIFSGFASVASKFGTYCDVTYVDNSNETTLSIEEKPQNIRKIVKGDVLDYIYFNASPCLIISCKTSANWHHSFQLDKLIKAIERNRYKLVLIDFFDADSIRVSNRFTAKELGTSVEWNLDKVTDKNPAYGHSVAEVKGIPTSVNGSDEFITKFGVYNKKALLGCLKLRLPNYEIAIHTSQIPEDPSFTVAIKEKCR